MLSLIIPILTQSVIGQPTDIINNLECSGLVYSYHYQSDSRNYYYKDEWGYPAGVCWSNIWSDDEGNREEWSIILQCEDNQISVIQYENSADCGETDDEDDWSVSFPTDGCTSELWSDSAICMSYDCGTNNNDDATGSGCSYAMVRYYYDTECTEADASADEDLWAGNDYDEFPYVLNYCYTRDDYDEDYPEYNHEENFVMSKNGNNIIKTVYSDTACTKDAEESVFAPLGSSCTADDDGDLEALYVVSDTADTDDLVKPDTSINGQACIATGDPHFITFNGQYHHFQGQNGARYYYVAPCGSYDFQDLPFTILATHFEWTGGSTVMGVKELEVELYDTDGDKQYVLVISPLGYDDNCIRNAGETDCNDIPSGKFGDRFQFDVVEDVYTITIDDADNDEAENGVCTVEFKFKGATVTILPPACYRTYMCGLCGDFEADGNMQACDGSSVQIASDNYDEDTFWEDPNIYDGNGFGWEYQYFQDCRARRRRLQVSDNVYSPILPDNFTISNPCNSTIRSLATISCQTARDESSECCDILGGDVCDSIQEDCAFDACVSAGNNVSAIDGYVKELFTDAVDSVCTIPGIESIMSEENLVPNQDRSTSDDSKGDSLLEGVDDVVVYGIVGALILCCCLSIVCYCLFQKRKSSDQAEMEMADTVNR